MTKTPSAACHRPSTDASAVVCAQAGSKRNALTKPKAPQVNQIEKRHSAGEFIDQTAGSAIFASPATAYQLLLSLCLFLGVAIPCLAVGVTGLASATGQLALPYPLLVLEWRLPGLFTLHMAASAISIIVLPWALLTRGHGPHRLIGPVAAVTLLLGVGASIPGALASLASPATKLGFLTQAVLCLVFLILALRAIRRGNVLVHAQMMMRVSALVFGVVLLRLMTFMVARSDLPFDKAYAAIAWVAWFVPLAGVYFWQHRRRHIDRDRLPH